MANLTMFYILAVVILGSVIMCVLTKRIIWTATFLIFVLFSVVGIYFLLGYAYLGTAWITIYVGDITIPYIFVMQLTSKRTLQGLVGHPKGSHVIQGTLLSLIGLAAMIGVLMKNQLIHQVVQVASAEAPTNVVGQTLIGSEKYQYVSPFEFISVFLLACTIGGLLIARKEDGE